MKHPNFFIIGAPKCGTTSLASWLGEHSKIFMSAPKEIYYFDTDQNVGEIKSLGQYLHIFKNANNEHLAVGEASVTYLSSHVAAKNILSFNPDAKFIVMLRNPIAMAPSLHLELLWDGWECIEIFDEAWNFRKGRASGTVPKGTYCTVPEFLDYENMCKLGEQVERLLNTVDKKSVLFVVMDDLVINPLGEYNRVLEFLGVPYSGKTKFDVVNARKRSRSLFVRRLTIAMYVLKCKVGLDKSSFGLLNGVDYFNNKRQHQPMLNPLLKQELIDTFRNDVTILSGILGRDLSHWLK